MENEEAKKARTSITLDPALWERAKTECLQRQAATGKRVSFSELVEEALQKVLGDSQ